MIAASGLTKRYGGKIAVNDLSFEVRPGVVTGFLGPNGAGKSTTMRRMLDLDYGGGETRFDGRLYRDIRHPMRAIGTVLEARAFHPTRSARNHLRMLAAANGIATPRVDEVLAMVGLGEVARKQPRGFSLGMAQRLGLAAALLGDPHTLILDEPANGLDPHGIQWLRDLLKMLASQGRTVFVSSHFLPEMALMADELVVIGRGRLIASGTVDSFVRDFTRTSVLVRSPQIDTLIEAVADAVPAVEVARESDGTALLAGVETARVGEIAAWRAWCCTSWPRAPRRWRRPFSKRAARPRNMSPAWSPHPRLQEGHHDGRAEIRKCAGNHHPLDVLDRAARAAALRPSRPGLRARLP